jgi:hypothetical protein
MPTVPTTFVPQVSPADVGMQPYQSAPVTGVKNYTPEQMEAQGNATANAGGALLNLSAKMEIDAARAARTTAAMNAKIQDTMDENAAKAADTAFMSEASQLLHGKGGYFSTKGLDAETRYKATEQALLTAGSRQQASLTTDAQRTMFTSSVARTTTSFLSQMGDHWNRENAVYGAQEANARGEQYANAAVNNYQDSFKIDGQYNANLITARNELTYGLSQLGVYEGSAQHRQSMSKLNSTVARGVVNRYMNDKRFADGIAYVESLTEANGIDAATSSALMDSLKSNREVQMDQELAYSILNSGTFTTPSGSGNFMNPVNGGEVVSVSEDKGLILSVPAGTAVRAPADATITKSDNDTLVLTSRDGTVITFSGVDNTKLKEGDVVGRGDTLGIPRGSDKGVSEFSYSVDRNGIPIAADGINQIVATDSTANPPLTLREARGLANRLPDLQQRERVKALITAQWNAAEALTKYEQSEALDVVLNLWANDKIASPEQMDALNPQDRRKFKDAVLGKAQTELEQALQLEALQGNLTREFVRENWHKVSYETTKGWLEKINSGAAAPANIDQDLFTQKLYEVGMSDMVKPDTDIKKQQALALRNGFAREIESAQEETGKALTRKEKEERMDRYLATVRVTEWGTDSTVFTRDLPATDMAGAYYEFDGNEIGYKEFERVRKQIQEEDLVRRMNNPSLTGNIISPRNISDDMVRQYIKNEQWKALNPGKTQEESK